MIAPQLFYIKLHNDLKLEEKSIIGRKIYCWRLNYKVVII